jgi:hypothetical protein
MWIENQIWFQEQLFLFNGFFSNVFFSIWVENPIWLPNLLYHISGVNMENSLGG